MKPPIDVLSIFNDILEKITPDKTEIDHIEDVTTSTIKIIRNSKIPDNFYGRSSNVINMIYFCLIRSNLF